MSSYPRKTANKPPTAAVTGQPAKRPLSRLTLTVATTIGTDRDAALAVVHEFGQVGLREVSLAQLNQAYANLYRAGVRPDMRTAMPGRALMTQLQAELERRAALAAQHPARAVVRMALAPGGYSAALQQVAQAYDPKRHSVYA
jgi:hypothetical protein